MKLPGVMPAEICGDAMGLSLANVVGFEPVLQDKCIALGSLQIGFDHLAH
jgi:hypothetical protein